MVLTASAGAFAGLRAALDPEQLTVEEHPLISFAPPESWVPLDSALTELASFGSIAFTSPRAAQAVVQRSSEIGVRWPPVGDRPALWAVGAGTRAALGGVAAQVREPEPNVSGDSAAAAILARAMLASGAAAPVLFPCGENRREELPTILRQHGVEIREVVCYRSVLASCSQAGMALSRGRIVVVASPSVMQLLAAASNPGERPRIVAVGPTTAAAARAVGWPPAVVAEEPSTQGVAAAITSLLVQS